MLLLIGSKSKNESLTSPDAREKPFFLLKKVLERQQENGLQIKPEPFAPNSKSKLLKWLRA